MWKANSTRAGAAAVLLAAILISACSQPVGQAAPATGAAPAAPVARTKLVTAYSETVFNNLPLWTAKESGIFEKNGLDVELQQINSSTSIAALLSGQVQVTIAGGSETLSANVAGADLEVVAVTGGYYPYWLMAQANITRPEELKGKKVGISQAGSSSDIATRVALRRFNLDPNTDVSIVPVGSQSNRTAALLSGAIDAGLDNPPGALAQLSQGLHPLIDMAGEKLPTANNAVVMQRSFVEANPVVVQRYVDSLVEALGRVKTDRAYSVQLYKKYFQTDDDDAMNKTYDFMLEYMSDLPWPTTDQFTDIVAQLQSHGEAVTQADVSKLLVTSFVQSAADRKVTYTAS